MQQTDDGALLRQYVENDSNEAFAALVARHINLVYSVALRHVGDPHHAEEITQAVFIIFGEKAAQLRHDKALSSWLFQTTRLTACNFVRSEIRRRRREQEAYMQSTFHESADDAWLRIAPFLDAAVAGLSEKDRQAVVLRFYEGREAREIGAVLGTSEEAAQKRVTRALEKLRRIFLKRGVTLSITAIAGAAIANSVNAAPSGLAVTVAAASAKSAGASATITSLAKGTLKLMAHAKLKLAVGIGLGILLATGVTTVVFQSTSDTEKVQAIAKQSQEAYAALSSYSDSGTALAEGGMVTTTEFSTRLQRPNLYRIEATTTGGPYTEIGEVWSDGTGDFLMTETAGQKKHLEPTKMSSMQLAFALGAASSGNASLWIPGTFFTQRTGDALAVMALGRSRLKKEHDQKVGNIDCSVITSVIDPSLLPNQGRSKYITKMGTSTTTLWIGKGDHLIHKMRETLEGTIISPLPQSDAVITTLLERQNKPVTPESIAALRSERMKMMNQQIPKYVFTQTHENIVVNQKYLPADFAH